MIIEFLKSPACLNFPANNKFTIDSVKKTKEGINFTYNKTNITVPWSNIVAIEEK